MGPQYDISIYGRLRTQIRMLFFYFFYTCVAPLAIFVLFFSNHRARLEAGKFSELFGQRGTKLVKIGITFKNYYKNSNRPSLSYKVKLLGAAPKTK